MRELPDPAVDASAEGYMPGCPILIEATPDYWTRDQVLAIQKQAYEDGLLDADKDAERYRWLRLQDNGDFCFAVVKNPHFDVYEKPEELDAAIDAALKE